MSEKMTDEEAIEALTDEDVVNPYLTLEALEIAINALKERAERKTGKWIHQYKEIPSMATFKCSCCGCVDEIAEKYCSNCGARMKGEGDETD